MEKEEILSALGETAEEKREVLPKIIDIHLAKLEQSALPQAKKEKVKAVLKLISERAPKHAAAIKRAIKRLVRGGA